MYFSISYCLISSKKKLGRFASQGAVASLLPLWWLIIEGFCHRPALESRTKESLIYDLVAASPTGEWREAGVAMLGVKRGLAGALFGCQGALCLGKSPLAGFWAEAQETIRDLPSRLSPIAGKLFLAGKFLWRSW